MGLDGNGTYQVKSWQFYLFMATLLVTSGVAWGTLQAQTNQNARDIQEIKAERYVPKDDYWRGMGELKDQVNKLEGKIDALTKLLK